MDYLKMNVPTFRCAEKSCNAKLYIDEDSNITLKKEMYTLHNNLLFKNLGKWKIISNQVKKKR